MRFLLISLTAFITATSSAQDAPLQTYEVELIIFRVQSPTGSPENWALKTPARVEDDASESPAIESAPAPPAEAFPALAPTQFRMGAVADSLRRSKMYQPLAHIGWTQPGFPLSAAPRLSLQGYLPGFLSEGVTLTGEASLARGARLLHLSLDLTYQTADGQRYVLRETRRMRSTERHYFDHPYFGVIALITPKS